MSSLDLIYNKLFLYLFFLNQHISDCFNLIRANNKKEATKVLLPAKPASMLKQYGGKHRIFHATFRIPPKSQNVFALGALERQVSYRAAAEELNYLFLYKRLVLENYLIVSAQNTALISLASLK